ncbi:hypothetical protein [Paenibacillus sp. WLX2291]|uniref:hypothetical protein n=1 Tax=Paenibacillus sp. WLX2291 TaxID=3296934 RepID=UPI003983ECE4
MHFQIFNLLITVLIVLVPSVILIWCAVLCIQVAIRAKKALDLYIVDKEKQMNQDHL